MENSKMLILSIAMMMSAVVGINASEEKIVLDEVLSLYRKCHCFSSEAGHALEKKWNNELNAIFESQNKTQDEKRRIVAKFLTTEDYYGITPMMYAIRNYAKNSNQDNACESLLSSGLRFVSLYGDLLKPDNQHEDSNK